MLKKITLGILMVAFFILAPADRALANDACLVNDSSAESLWAELDAVQEGRAPVSAVQGVTAGEWTMAHEPIEPGPAPEVANRFLFSLHPYGAYFTTPYNPIGSVDGLAVPFDAVLLHDTLPPMVQIGEMLELQDWLHIRLVLDLTPSVRFMNGSGWYTPWNVKTLVMEFPRESYISISRPHAGLAVGRFKTGIGFGYFGNTFLNGKAPFYDQVQGTYYSDHFRFFYLLGSSQSFLTPREAEVQAINWDTINNHDGSAFDNPVKVFAYHLLEYRPFDWATVGVGEMSLVGGKFPDFDQVNPVGIWHNTYSPGCSNVMGTINISLVPLNGLHLYGEFTADDFRLPTEEVLSKPNAFAYQAGWRYVLPFSQEIKHVVGAEFTHVDPWTYNRWQPYLTMYQRIMKTGPMYMDVPLGYPYGGDLNHFGLYYSAVSRSGFSVQASISRLDKGEVNLGLDSGGNPYFDHYNDAGGPTGVVERRYIADLSLDCPLTSNLSLSVSGNYAWISDFRHVVGAAEGMGMVRVGVKWRL